MGTWGSKPWDNDAAADWYVRVFDETDLAGKAEATLSQEKITEDNFEEVRAAAFLLIALGRVYVWPILKLKLHLALAANCMEQILQNDDIILDEETRQEIEGELAQLHSQMSSDEKVGE